MFIAAITFEQDFADDKPFGLQVKKLDWVDQPCVSKRDFLVQMDVYKWKINPIVFDLQIGNQ